MVNKQILPEGVEHTLRNEYIQYTLLLFNKQILPYTLRNEYCLTHLGMNTYTLLLVNKQILPEGVEHTLRNEYIQYTLLLFNKQILPYTLRNEYCLTHLGMNTYTLLLVNKQILPEGVEHTLRN